METRRGVTAESAFSKAQHHIDICRRWEFSVIDAIMEQIECWPIYLLLRKTSSSLLQLNSHHLHFNSTAIGKLASGKRSVPSAASGDISDRDCIKVTISFTSPFDTPHKTAAVCSIQIHLQIPSCSMPVLVLGTDQIHNFWPLLRPMKSTLLDCSLQAWERAGPS